MLGKFFPGKPLISPDVQIPLTFRLAGERSLHLPADSDMEATGSWRYLSHHARRYPHDLRNHVQRILLAKENAMSDRLPGSLLDLFLALGNAGNPLKQTMLSLVSEQLSEADQVFFADWAERGLSAEAKNRWMPGSILSTGENTPTLELVVQQRAAKNNQYESLLAEVQDYLEYGQIEQAQSLLETEIIDGRGTPELEEELIIIYQHTRNKHRLTEMADAILAADAGVTDLWANARAEAENW